jgi:hypothetical protein
LTIAPFAAIAPKKTDAMHKLELPDDILQKKLNPEVMVWGSVFHA